MILVIDCFKLVKGGGKSIGIYNLALNLVNNLVIEQKLSLDSEIKKSKIIILGNKYNRSDFDIEGVEFIEIKNNPLNKVTCIWWELFLVNKYSKKLNADRILFPRGFSALTHPVRDTIIVHDLIPFYYNKHYPDFFNKFENAYIMNRLKASIKSCNQVITISKASKEEILKLVDVKEEKIITIYNGCNKLECNKTIYNQKPYIIAITSDLPHKNAKGIIESYKEYCNISKEPLDLKIIGIKNVDKYNLPINIKNKITCFKFIKDDMELQNLISNGSVFIFLSLIEGFGFPPIEAMQLGVPVICSNTSSLPEVVGDAAILVNPTDYKDIGKEIYNLINNSDKQRKLVECGYKNTERFSWKSRSKLYWETLLK